MSCGQSLWSRCPRRGPAAGLVPSSLHIHGGWTFLPTAKESARPETPHWRGGEELGRHPRSRGGAVSGKACGGWSQHPAGDPAPASSPRSVSAPKPRPPAVCLRRGSLCVGTGASRWLRPASRCGQGRGSLWLISNAMSTPPHGPHVIPESITGRASFSAEFISISLFAVIFELTGATRHRRLYLRKKQRSEGGEKKEGKRKEGREGGAGAAGKKILLH